MTATMRTAADQSVGNKAASDQSVGGFFATAMEVARLVWPSKTAETLATIFGTDVRSAERHLAGHRTGNAEKLGALIISEAGDAIIKRYVELMPPQRRTAFLKEMAKAARRAELLEERARLERELSQVGG